MPEYLRTALIRGQTYVLKDDLVAWLLSFGDEPSLLPEARAFAKAVSQQLLLATDAGESDGTVR